jgi:hypothetical protein
MQRIALLVSVSVLAIPLPAQAASPPTGKYDCTIGSSQILFGTLAIKANKKYAHRGTNGTFTTTRAKKIRFKKGDLDGLRGRFYKSTGGIWEIALRNPEDDFESIYCDKRR